MENGATGGTVGRLNGNDNDSYGFGVRFNNMKDYGLAQDKLNGENFWSNHIEFLDETEPRGMTLARVLETTWN